MTQDGDPEQAGTAEALARVEQELTRLRDTAPGIGVRMRRVTERCRAIVERTSEPPRSPGIRAPEAGPTEVIDLRPRRSRRPPAA